MSGGAGYPNSRIARMKPSWNVAGTSHLSERLTHLDGSSHRRLPTVRCWLWVVCLGVVVATLPGTVWGGEWTKLKARQDLTPESLLRCFANFSFELGERVQDPETFLERKRGDCDDFACLAASLLAERGYKTKLVTVMMQAQTHVVCYVQEARGFLDFNHRADPRPVVPSDGSLEDIALKVSTYFRSKWWMASEIKYEGSTPVFLDSAFPSGPALLRSEPGKVEAALGAPLPDKAKASVVAEVARRTQ